MNQFDCKKIVFSSSATSICRSKSVPITEIFSLCDTNPYGRFKLFIEEILQDLYESDNT